MLDVAFLIFLVRFELAKGTVVSEIDSKSFGLGGGEKKQVFRARAVIFSFSLIK